MLKAESFIMVVYCVIRSKSRYGMPCIVKKVLEDTTIYFIVMAVCHSVLGVCDLCKSSDTHFRGYVAHPYQQTTIKLLPTT